MRIGINASFLRKPCTGIGQVSQNFIRELASDKYKKDEFFLYTQEEAELELPDNFTQETFLPCWKRDDLIRQYLWERWSLPRRAHKDKCDVLLSLYQSATYTKKGVRHIMVVHDIIPKLFPQYLNNRRKQAYQRQVEKGMKRADYLIAISKRTEKDILQHSTIDAQDITTSYVDVDPIFKQFMSQEQVIRTLRKYDLVPGYVYYGGGLELRKNVENLVLAYKHLLEEKNGGSYPDLNLPPLVISGKLLPQLSPLVTDVEKLIYSLNLTQHVKILGQVAQEDLPALYAGANIFVYPSLYEGFGLPVLEAMNVGTPVIASKRASLPEVGGDAVLYCEPEDIKDIQMVMRRLLAEKTLREELVRRGKERAKRFSWEQFVQTALSHCHETRK